MKNGTMATLCLATLLAACGDGGPPKTETRATPAPAKPAGPPINRPVEDALGQIPPEMREPYQAAFACEVKRRQADGVKEAIVVTPDYVRGLLTRLKAQPSLAKC